MQREQLPFLERANKLAVDFVSKLASGKGGGGFLRTVGNIIKVIAGWCRCYCCTICFDRNKLVSLLVQNLLVRK